MKAVSFLMIIMIILSSCKSLKNSEELRFKALIGEDNSTLIGEMFQSMDEHLEKKYKTKSKSENYNLFLKEVLSTEKQPNKGLFQLGGNDCKKYKEYLDRDLGAQFQRIEYDKVYFDGEALVLKWDTNYVRITSLNKTDETEKIEIVKERIAEGRSVLIHKGRMLEGLKKVGTEDALIKEYIEARTESKRLSRKITAKKLLDSGANIYKNFLYRLIFFEEMYIHELIEKEC